MSAIITLVAIMIIIGIQEYRVAQAIHVGYASGARCEGLEYLAHVRREARKDGYEAGYQAAARIVQDWADQNAGSSAQV